MQESFSSSQKGLPHRDLTLVRHMLYLYNGAMELMAPAGDLQSAYQALTHGADAVYLGLQDYSARRSATNFSIEELRRLKSYALEHGKAIYVTMNTIIKDDELAGVLQMLHHLALIAVDASSCRISGWPASSGPTSPRSGCTDPPSWQSIRSVESDICSR